MRKIDQFNMLIRDFTLPYQSMNSPQPIDVRQNLLQHATTFQLSLEATSESLNYIKTFSKGTYPNDRLIDIWTDTYTAAK